MVTISNQILLYVHVTYAAAYENLALNKTTWQQHDWPGKEVEWGAAKAVDGLYTDRSAGGNQCTISYSRHTTATWRVDLGSVVSISYIDIYYRTENAASPGLYYDRFAGFFLYVSNTSSRDDGHLCFHEIQSMNGTPTENQTISCSVHGRYVIYYNERRPDVTYPSYYSQYAYNSLCEVEVQGCSDPTKYGVNCDQQCSEGCQEKRCHISTGDCLGCIPGYRGIRCSQECQPGFYGKNCGQRCSWNCKVTNRCNRFTGECDGGCGPGWKTPRCQQEALSSCPICTCSTDDNTAIIISLVVSVIIVLIGSVVNFLMWKINQPRKIKTRENVNSEPTAVRSTDHPSSSNRVQFPYVDLGNLDQPNTYDELHQHADGSGDI